MYLSKAGSAGSLHLVFLAEVLVMSVQDTAWEAGPGYHLIVLTQPANTMQRKVYELVVVTCAYVYGCVRSLQTHHWRMRGLEHLRFFSDFGLERTT